MTKQTARRIRIAGGVLLGLYILLLVYVLFLSEQYGRTGEAASLRYNLQPLREIRRFVQNREILGGEAVWLNLAGNVLLFVPLGAILPVLSRRMRSFPRILGASLGLSLAVETAQLLSRTGAFDVDDLLLNTLGGVAGWLVFALCDQIRRRIYG